MFILAFHSVVSPSLVVLPHATHSNENDMPFEQCQAKELNSLAYPTLLNASGHHSTGLTKASF